MSEIKVIMSFNIHSHKSHKPRTIPKRWRLWIELLKAFPSGFAKQQSWEDGDAKSLQLSCFMQLLMLFLPLHLINCVRFFTFFSSSLSDINEVMGNLRSIPAEQVQVQSSLHLSLRMFLVFQLRGALENRTCLRAFRFVEALSGSRWRHEASRSQETVWFGIFKCSTMSTILEYNVNSSQASVPIVVIIP